MLSWISHPLHQVIAAAVLSVSAIAGLIYCIRATRRK